MKCRIATMREQGIALPKSYLKDRLSYEGELEIWDTQDGHLRRMVKVAKFTQDGWSPKLLYEVHLIWMSEARFTLQGYERVPRDGQVIEFAQSWLCLFD